MQYIILYDGSGIIVGKVSTNDSRQLLNYDNYIEVDKETHESAPELWGEIDIATKKVKAKIGHVDPRKKP